MAHTFINKSQHNGQTGNPISVNHTPGAVATVAIVSIVVAGSTGRAGGAPTIDGTTATIADQLRTAVEVNIEVWYVCKAFSGSQFAVSIPNTGSLTCHVEIVTAYAGSGVDSAYHSSNGNAANSGDGFGLTFAQSAQGDFKYARLGCGEGALASITPTWTGATEVYAYDPDGYVMWSHYLICGASNANPSWAWSNDDGAAVGVCFKSMHRYQRATEGNAAPTGSIVRKHSGKRQSLGQSLFSGIVEGIKSSGLVASFTGELARIFHAVRSVSGGLTAGGEIFRECTLLRSDTGALTSGGEIPSRLFAGHRGTEGAESFAGEIRRFFAGKRTTEGGLTFFGVVDAVRSGITQFFRAVEGVLTATAEVIRKATQKRPQEGIGSFGGEVSRLFKGGRSIEGDLTFSGILSRAADLFRSVAGELSGAGEVVRKLLRYRLVLGVVSFVGEVERYFAGKRQILGDLSWGGGILTRSFAGMRSILGELTFSGILIRTTDIFRTIAGELSGAGEAIRKFVGYRMASGAESFIGEVARLFTGKRQTLGGLSFAAWVEAIKTSITQFFRDVAGVLGFEGTVLRKFAGHRILTGILNGVHQYFEIIAGILAWGGGILTRKATYHRYIKGWIAGPIISEIAGILSWGGGVLVRVYDGSRQVLGSLVSTGDVSRKGVVARAVEGIVDFLGSPLRKFAGFRFITGTLTFSGIITWIYGPFYRAVQGVLVWGGGIVVRVFSGHRIEAGEISFTGTVLRVLSAIRTIGGDLISSGIVTRLFSGARQILGAVSFAAIPAWTWGVIYRAVEGILSWGGGIVVRLLSAYRSDAGELSSSGSISRKGTFKRILTGLSSFYAEFGSLMTATQRAISGILSFAGSLVTGGEIVYRQVTYWFWNRFLKIIKGE